MQTGASLASFIHSYGMTEPQPLNTRPPAVAGFFYPDDADDLTDTVDTLVRAVRARRPVDDQPPFAIVVPHAGFAYSAPIAAEAYALLPRYRRHFERVLLLGPAHRVGFRGMAAPSTGAFRTPLGDVAIDTAAIAALSQLPQVAVRDDAHAQEHSLEVQLPFLQRALDRFKLIPLVVGQATPTEVAEVISAMTAEPGTLVVISSDLSHYLDYDTAGRLDRQTVDAILALDGGAIRDEGACGRLPIKGLLEVARTIGLSPELLDLRNSGDTAGSKDRVVGYASLIFRNDDRSGLSKAARDTLLHVAERSIRHGLETGQPAAISADGYAEALGAQGACFVTLKSEGRLRGCIGSLAAHRPLIVDAAENAFAAAFRDPRFSPITAEEFDRIDTLEMSVLSPARPLAAGSLDLLAKALKPGIDGLIVRDGDRRATFLPQVWQQLPERRHFLAHLWRKAGLPADHWSNEIRLWTYRTQSFARVAQR